MRKYWILGFLVFTTTHLLHAQAVSEQLWFEYFLNHPFGNVWNLENTFTYSTGFRDPRWRSYEFQIMPERSMGQHVDLMAAFLVSSTVQNDSISSLEMRPMIGVKFHFTPHKRILTRLFLRFEERYFKNLETNDWEGSGRIRARAEATIPINKPTMFAGDKLWYGIVDFETFFVMDQDVNERFANRIRIRAGLGYRINYTWRLELVYTYQESKSKIGEDVNAINNIFRVRVKHYLHKTKPSKATGSGN